MKQKTNNTTYLPSADTYIKRAIKHFEYDKDKLTLKQKDKISLYIRDDVWERTTSIEATIMNKVDNILYGK